MAKNDDWSPQDERIAMAAIAFASDHGPIPAARKGDVGAKTIVASLLCAQLAARGLKIVDDI